MDAEKIKINKQLKDVNITQQQIYWQASREESEQKDILVHVPKSFDLGKYYLGT